MKYTGTGKIKINPSNPRIIKDEKYRKLVRSVAQFPKMMDLRGIVVDASKMILGGNQRWRAIMDILKMPESELLEILEGRQPEFALWETLREKKAVPENWIVDGSAMTDDEIRRFIIADNVEFGEHDWDALANGWDAEELDGWGVDVPDFAGGGKGEAQEDEYEIPEEIQTDIQPGDLFEIGPHRLLCGDSTVEADVVRLMDGVKADIVFTDPPYSSGGFQESGKTSGSIGARGGVKIENDNLSTRGYISLMDKVLGNIKNAHTVFIFCDWKMWSYNQDIAEAKGFRVRNMIVWDKMQMGMGMPFRNQHELCLFGSKVAGKIGDGATPNVLSFPRDRESEHATPKPPELIKKMIGQVLGDIIVDPFIGGGSTMVAAHQLDRKCYGMEIDPKYCQVIVDRMLKLDPDLEIKKNGQPYSSAEPVL